MDHQSHNNHIYQFSVIEDNLKAEEEQQLRRQQKRQQQQALQENLALRRLRRQQQQQQQQQQPQLHAVEQDREDTPPNDPQEAIREPQRPQKEPGTHRALMNFQDPSKAKWRRQKSCSRINFITAFDDTKNERPTNTEVIQMTNDNTIIRDDDTIALIDDKSKGPFKSRPRAKSMSSLDIPIISNDEAQFIASSVIQVLDKKQAHAFVKDKLMRNVHISRMTKEEISAIVNIHEVSLSTNSDASTSTEGDSSFHSAPSDNQSPVSVNINSGAVQFSPSKKTPKKLTPPTRPSLRQERNQWKQKFAQYDQAYSELVHQLLHPQQTQPSTSKAVQQQQQPQPSTSAPQQQQQPLVTSPRAPCNLCDNSRFFLFSPEARKKLTCSCSNQVTNNWKEPEPPAATQRQQQDTETPLPPATLQTPPRRVTRYGGERQGVWDKTTQIFKKYKK